MGLPVPKQFMKIDGETMVAKTTRVFACNKLVDAVVVVFPQKYVQKIERSREEQSNIFAAGATKKRMLEVKKGREKESAVEGIRHAVYGTQRAHIKNAILKGIGEIRENLKFMAKNAGKKCVITVGDETRGGSVKNGLAALPDDIEIVLVHDAARPYVDERIVNDVIAAAEVHGAAVPTVPLKDSLRTARCGVNRDDYFLVQTPQGFSRRILQAAYYEAERKGMQAADDAALVEAMGEQVVMVEGSYKNIKITTVEDLE